MSDDDHPEIPVDEWDARHLDWETETCTLCGSDLHYVGTARDGHINCEASGECLFQP